MSKLGINITAHTHTPTIELDLEPSAVAAAVDVLVVDAGVVAKQRQLVVDGKGAMCAM